MENEPMLDSLVSCCNTQGVTFLIHEIMKSTYSFVKPTLAKHQ